VADTDNHCPSMAICLPVCPHISAS
jgi:hypothetical protein